MGDAPRFGFHVDPTISPNAEGINKAIDATLDMPVREMFGNVVAMYAVEHGIEAAQKCLYESIEKSWDMCREAGEYGPSNILGQSVAMSLAIFFVAIQTMRCDMRMFYKPTGENDG